MHRTFHKLFALQKTIYIFIVVVNIIIIIIVIIIIIIIIIITKKVLLLFPRWIAVGQSLLYILT